MDNRRIEIVSEGDAALKTALSLIWPNAPGGKSTHWRVARLREVTTYYDYPDNPKRTTHHSTRLVEDEKGCQTLIMLWHDEGKHATPLPYPLDFDGTYQFILGWLKQADYGGEPDHDGSNGRGWMMFTNFWGHVADHHYGICGVQPAWAMYGK